MAPKIPPQLRQQPSKDEVEKDQESGSETEADSEEEGDEGSSGDEHEHQENPKLDKTLIPAPNFDSESTDSDPESEVNPSDFKVEPILKPHAAPPKRGNQEIEPSRNAKKAKTENKSGGIITRLWSNEDEIAVLNGMVDFKNQKGLDPNSDMAGFYSHVKGKLQVDFTRAQLKSKMARMKKRFFNALKKGGENGEDPVFSNPHEAKAFEISKKIWGGGVGKGAKNVLQKESVRVEKNAVDKEEIVEKEKDGEEWDFWSKYPFMSSSFRNVGANFPSLGMSEVLMNLSREKLSLIGDVKAKELDDKWKKLLLEEAELNHKMLTLMKEQVKMAFSG